MLLIVLRKKKDYYKSKKLKNNIVTRSNIGDNYPNWDNNSWINNNNIKINKPIVKTTLARNVQSGNETRPFKCKMSDLSSC